MSTSVGFQTQITSIMEVLTKAAVAEICKLVDEGYAVLQLEISRSRQENEILKQKLSIQMMATGAAQEIPANGNPLSSLCTRGHRNVKVHDQRSIPFHF